jgi:hypothetical protein
MRVWPRSRTAPPTPRVRFHFGDFGDWRPPGGVVFTPGARSRAALSSARSRARGPDRIVALVVTDVAGDRNLG